ncbi:MarR family winged helix-turn-helix transcriptional regulator [Streptomyces sp. NPDC003758]|uniref:MarR family transcriptional regulator n=1 Tax=Streptomyces cynarae TaxID=2981134 RepID=A0ABY6DY21_9ACTN|nr:MarR family transcriptional regulator [Streptomyces cynarae]UXY19229.1 MarR family transcriptional regulator [Streptomyces cynarae]
MNSGETDGTTGGRGPAAVAVDGERRARALEQLMTVGRQHSAVTVMFHSAIAAKQGLNATEEKTLDFLERRGPLTAKDLAELTGLAPASVTGLVDRLESKGFVRRVKHPTDKRRVLVELNQRKLGEFAVFFEEWARDIVDACEEFSAQELETVVRFLAVMSERQSKFVARLSE